LKLDVKQFVNESLTSNAYLVRLEDSLECVLVDIGEYTELKKHLLLHGLSVQALFLTHCHYDHILGLREFINEFPKATIFAHSYTMEALKDPKLNLSFYREVPREIDIPPQNRNLMVDQDVEIASLKVTSLHTPGHNPGSLSFLIGNFLFTGDSLIPGHKIVTKLKGGNKEQAQKSLEHIINNLNDVKYLAPGHGSMLPDSSFRQLVEEQYQFYIINE